MKRNEKEPVLTGGSVPKKGMKGKEREGSAERDAASPDGAAGPRPV